MRQCELFTWFLTVLTPSFSKDGKERQKVEKLEIKLHDLPPYSPNLNPVKRLTMDGHK
ncbi:MAG: hypothetical protein QS748_03040 [Candidatus Endonucleobacter bathymodioli]|uniref:Tc1-like transposase DDE domain-containing protein n=1 Tax=Candidatus Endonucleibacter bathymodioli TaxID=539814 RepID=A0AA90NS06_9GAMM|nr:hypothetical protein [Candidatus Endonucleobacter bathymodioli]